MAAQEQVEVLSSHQELTTGERIRILRRRRRWTLRDLAERTGLSHSLIAAVERGETVPGGETIRSLAVALGTSTDYLLRLRHTATPPKAGGKRTDRRRRHPTQARQVPLVVPVD